MERGPILIIVNPVSGRRRAVRLAHAVAEYIRGSGICVEVRETTGKLSGQQIATDACNDDSQRPACVVACGGDGTIQEVANALSDWKAATFGTGSASAADPCPTLGVAPGGRCNDFATVLGIPNDAGKIAETILRGVPVPIDLGRITSDEQRSITKSPGRQITKSLSPSRYFCTVATLGVDAQVSGFVDRMRLPLKGTPAYVYGAIRVLSRYRPSHVRLEGDFGVIQRPVFLATSANTSTYGGAIPIAPEADPTDGLLDLCVIDSVSRIRAFSMIPIVMAGRHVNREGVHFIRTRRVSMATQQPAEIWADGECIGETPATIDIVPAAVRVMLPATSPYARK